VAGAVHQGFVDDQLPLAVVEVGVQGVVALGNGEAIQVEVGVGVQNRGVIGAQTPYLAIRLERAFVAENLPAPDGGGVVVDPNILAVDGNAGFGARTLGVLSTRSSFFTCAAASIKPLNKRALNRIRFISAVAPFDRCRNVDGVGPRLAVPSC
jgi:hypothetical protein